MKDSDTNKETIEGQRAQDAKESAKDGKNSQGTSGTVSQAAGAADKADNRSDRVLQGLEEKYASTPLQAKPEKEPSKTETSAEDKSAEKVTDTNKTDVASKTSEKEEAAKAEKPVDKASSVKPAAASSVTSGRAAVAVVNASAKQNFFTQNIGQGKFKPKGWQGVLFLVIALVLGLLIGWFCVPHAGSALGKSTLTEGELDTVVATYNYNGHTDSLTARDVYNATGTLQSSKNTEGNYTAPTADAILQAARTEIVVSEATKQGITVTDDELNEYAESTLGSSDFDTIGESYSLDTETVKNLLRQTLMQSKLRDAVVDTSQETPTEPQAPQAPEDNNPDAKSKDYATYIINLAGDEWDSDKQEWKSEDGQYAQALSGYKITNDEATYEAAQAAYSVAYEKYSEAATQTTTQWNDYVNGLLDASSITIATLGS